MGWSAGTFTRVHDWTSDDAADIDIEASRMDQEDDNFETGINTCLTKDGQNTPTADLPMGSNKHTGVGEGSARTHYAAIGQLQDGDIYIAGSVSGTDTVVGTLAPAITAYTNGMRVIFLPAGNNTGAATLNLNSVGAQSITKNGTTALAADDLVSGVWADVIYDIANTNWILLNPQTQKVASTTTITAGAGLTGGGDLSANRTVTVGAGTGITVNADDVALDTSNTRNVDHAAVTFTAGVGLSGGGTLAANRTFTVDLNELTTETAIAAGDFLAMVDITDSGSGKITFANLEATLNHDSLAGFVADEHVAHSGVSITAGSGLTGGGTIAASRTINVGAGDGISVAADAVAVDSTVVRTTGAQTVGGVKTFSSRPQSSSAGGFLSYASSTQSGGSITVSTSDPSGTPGAGDLWIKHEA